MTDSYAQEPAEVYGDQLHVASRLKFPFVRLAAKAIESMQAITVDGFVVYCILLKFADNADWTCYPTYKLIQNISGYGRKRVMKALKVLQQVNMIERKQMRKGREYGANLYTLIPVEEWTIENPDFGGAKMRPLKMEPSYRHHKLDLEELDLEETRLRRRTQNACAREETASLSFEHGEDEDRLATGEDIVFPESHGCMQYHPGLPCEHEQEVLSAVRGVLWPDRATLPKSHLSVRAFAHRYHKSLERVGAACKLAEWWKKTRKPRDWTIPLMFADPETELANEQSVQAPGGATVQKSPGAAAMLERLKNGGTIDD